jgi:RimJ/RimL family protein N-acetyltransferase
MTLPVVTERLEMRRETLLRGSVYEQAKWQDRVVYAILADDWRDNAASG